LINPLSLRITAEEAFKISSNDTSCCILDIRSRVSKQQSNWKISSSVSLEAKAEEINSWAIGVDQNNWVFFYCA
jgi:hypothetical protein